LKRRLQVSGYKLQGCGYRTDVALVDTKSNGQTSLTNPKVSVSVIASDTPCLKPETCSLMPLYKADS
jgi:hypothetical protein